MSKNTTSTPTLSRHSATTPDVTTESPKDTRWDQVRETSEQLRACGRLFLRGQVKLGLMLAALKKEFARPEGRPAKNLAESAKFLPWEEIVKQETGYSRRQCDEFIRLAEACKNKIKTSKTLNLPPTAKQNAIVIFQHEGALTLTESQWKDVDLVIGTLTTGETQASLMQELGLVPKPKAMPTAPKGKAGTDDSTTAGQLAFHFFEAMVSPLINSRTNPDYKMLLYALPVTSTEDHPLSLATLESECRAMLADIEDAKQAGAKPTKGKVIS